MLLEPKKNSLNLMNCFQLQTDFRFKLALHFHQLPIDFSGLDARTGAIEIMQK